jgi:hypothetical protein
MRTSVATASGQSGGPLGGQAILQASNAPDHSCCAQNTTEAKAAQFAKEVRPRCMLLDDKDFSTPDRVFGARAPLRPGVAGPCMLA